VDSVALTLEVNNAPNAIPRGFTFHRALRDWGEAGSSASGGTGAVADLGDATWRDAFFPTASWSSPGGDFEPTPSAMVWVAGLGTYTWRGSGLVNDVRAWLLRPTTNFGWLLQGDESALNTARRFASREAGDALTRPLLTIYYTPAAVARSNSWGSVKARYR
jgi:hypothetical protein